jgi:hypothetical protein
MDVNWDVVIMNLVAVIFALYATKANPNIPEIDKLFSKDLFKSAFIAGYVYIVSKDAQVAIVVALIIHIGSSILKNKKIF